jgi:Family of unknown function (DUF6130)
MEETCRETNRVSVKGRSQGRESSSSMNEGRHCMKLCVLLLFVVAMVSSVVATWAQTSTNEPPAKLIVDSPLPDLLAHGVVWIPWRAENVNIVPVVGKGALDVFPRVGHLHIHVDDLPWLWADMSTNPIDVALLPPGPHKIRIELVNAVHEIFPGQSKTVMFNIPERTSSSH